MSAHDQRRTAGIGVGSPDEPGPGDAKRDVPPHADPGHWEDGDVVQAVAAFVDDLVDGAAQDQPAD